MDKCIVSPLLREYQQKDYTRIRYEMSLGKKRVLYVSPTGAGKGTLAAYMVAQAVNRGKRVVFLVNRREIVKDMCRRLNALGIVHGVLMGSQTRNTHLPVQVASVDTLRNRLDRVRADLVFVDEAHFAVSDSWRVVLSHLDTFTVLMTATPCRLDGRGLGAIADVIVQGPTVTELTEQGYLVPARVFAPSAPDLTGVHTTAGDYRPDELAAAMDKPRLVGDIVSHWENIARDLPSVVFSVNCEHGHHITEQFKTRGYRFQFVDADTRDTERAGAFQAIANGTLQGIVSVGVISYGWDVPRVTCAVLARPTRSLSLYLQQCGRVLRPCVDKTDALILDHAGNTLRHGFIDDPREWTLDDSKRKRKSDAALPPELLPRVCPVCFAVGKPRIAHCVCGYKFSAREMMPEQVDGQLTEVKRRVYSPAAYGSSDDPGIQRIIDTARSRGWAPGAVWHKTKALETARSFYREQFGTDPKPHWNASVLNSMLEVAKLSVVS